MNFFNRYSIRTRHATARLTLVLLFSFAIANSVSEAQVDQNRPKAEQPNVLIIYADDLGYGDVQCYNPKSKIPTPNINRLANEGIRFTDAHSAATVCTPSRYSLLTGRYAFRLPDHGRVFDGIGGPNLITPERLSMGQMFSNLGYATACVGKWHIGMTFLTNRETPSTRADPNPLHESTTKDQSKDPQLIVDSITFSVLRHARQPTGFTPLSRETASPSHPRNYSTNQNYPNTPIRPIIGVGGKQITLTLKKSICFFWKKASPFSTNIIELLQRNHFSSITPCRRCTSLRSPQINLKEVATQAPMETLSLSWTSSSAASWKH